MKTDESIPDDEEAPPLTGQIVLIDSDGDELMAVTVALSTLRLKVMAVQPHAPLRAAARLVRREPAAIVMALDGMYNLVDVRAILAAGRTTRFVFLVPELPPKAALARVVSQYGATIISRDEAPMVLAATLIAMLADDSHGVA
ncbi:MAG: hypothetical protein M3P30_15060 [Chloroflexota bacterium]|nr:hypothetical protein [Chloroflexota bacterium]